jgi:hypothetical protein
MAIPYSRDQEGQKFWFAGESVKDCYMLRRAFVAVSNVSHGRALALTFLHGELGCSPHSPNR